MIPGPEPDVWRQPTRVEVYSCSKYLGQGSEHTNNVAEYEALLLGLRAAKAMGVRHLQAFVDSQVVCEQVNVLKRVYNPAMQRLHAKVWTLMRDFETITVSHTYRDNNTRADELANIAMSRKQDDESDALLFGDTEE
jgi:ribonuclease HI